MTERSALPPCPICGQAAQQRYRPFCSRRCADVDLGRWFSGQYRVPSATFPSEEDEKYTRRVDPDDEVG
ncbi:DNA gyrase inhibitor YacG [Komagataeibacter sp. FNDCF1]|uniref:DNA gyrase inhibitor YacG n=1 Tax=Komagataeibacter sp. FNDCF1 TaxID=2878681 RepID=UPI001E50CCC6|nr:DNA gyrase inhibitor YacG [Komagataeibacter sp. FNDCF1]MCE2564890.1 DNA gyrase inhibitor YacG [Komagataeibacter sp. FNDCF1]